MLNVFHYIPIISEGKKNIINFRTYANTSSPNPSVHSLQPKEAKLQSIDNKQTTPGRQPNPISMNRASTDLFNFFIPAAQNSRKKMPHKKEKTEPENQIQKKCASFALKVEFKNFDLHKQFGLPLL
ncbi:hypothetical protein CDAR_611461 [Caerostris darwini]|uniref:Uncharacterized protein n=1 Tax=Caerostris darwini TaxID=1538125 RepID=A0AAV4UQH8_9ARAC|nr:hypothetical protein CDAR_611461 [Caerostris darwini]